jgi:hypothetical protein
MKVNLSLCLIRHNTKIYSGNKIQNRVFLTSALEGNESLASRPVGLPFRKCFRHSLNGLDGPQRWSEHCGEAKNLCLCREYCSKT